MISFEQVENFKYLGVSLTKKLHAQRHKIDNIVGGGNTEGWLADSGHLLIFVFGGEDAQNELINVGQPCVLSLNGVYLYII